MPKAVYSREDVIAAGLVVLEKDGAGQFSARRVADELGSSTAPVYSNFANMEDLTVAVNEAVVDMMLSLMLEKHTDDPFLNMGVGVLEFARRRPRLYGAVFLHAGEDCVAGQKVQATLLERMEVLPDLDQLLPVERILVLNKLSIFTHGLATMICSGAAHGMPFEAMVALLSEVGHAILTDALATSPRAADDLALLGPLCESPNPSKTDEE